MERYPSLIIASLQSVFERFTAFSNVHWERKDTNKPRKMFIDGARFISSISEDRAIRGRYFSPCGHEGNRGRLNTGTKAQNP